MKLGFLLLIGLPGSGKTTLAKYLTRSSDEFSDNNNNNFIHVCYDDLICFTNGNHENEWKLARNSVANKIEKLLSAITNKNVDFCPEEFKNELTSVKSWECDFVLILDDNMYFKSMRYSLFQIAKKHKIGFCQVFLNCSLNSALLTNSLRGAHSKIPPHVIENMFSKIEPPNGKNNWEKFSITVEAYGNLKEIYNQILPVLHDSLQNVFYETDETETKELSQIQCKKSIIHQTDLALRKIIGGKIQKYLKENSAENSKEYIAGLNIRKSEILSDVKSGNICLPDDVIMEISSDEIEKFQLIHFFDSYF